MSCVVTSRLTQLNNRVGRLANSSYGWILVKQQRLVQIRDVKLTQNGTNLGFFKISFQNALKLILKSPKFVPFGAYLAQFGWKKLTSLIKIDWWDVVQIPHQGDRTTVCLTGCWFLKGKQKNNSFTAAQSAHSLWFLDSKWKK